MKDMENLKAKNEKLEKEIISARYGADNWRNYAKKICAHISNDFNKNIDNKVEALVKAKNEFNDDADTIKQNSKDGVSRQEVCC